MLPDIFLSTPFIGVYIVLGLCLMIQLIYHLSLYNRIPAAQKKQKEVSQEYPPLSIILCVENQVEYLRENISSILQQDYPNFEVIVVDIASDDGTKEYLEYLEENHDNLYFSFTPESARFISRRKLAQTIGIKASKYDWLVFTEIDSKPISSQWLKKLAGHFIQGTDIVLGYSKYRTEKTWINRFTSYDSFILKLRYLGMALKNKPYMGQGRNMAYRKSVFFQEKAFSNQLNLQRGEDELFLNQNVNSTNTRVELSPESIIEMEPIKRKKDWKLQKQSHLLSVQRFKGNKQYWMGLETTTRLLLYALGLPLFIYSLITLTWQVSLLTFLCFLLRWVVQFLTINRTAKVMTEGRRFYFSLPLLDILLPLNNFLIRLKMPRKGRGDILKI